MPAAGGFNLFDAAPYDLLRAIANLSITIGGEGAAHTRRMLGLVIDG